MKIIIGTNYLHPTLGLVKLVSWREGESSANVEVLTNNYKLNSNDEWTDDWGYNFTIDQGQQWWIELSKLKPLAKPKLTKKDKQTTPVQIRCKDLWNKSNYIKNNPKQAYT